MGARMMERIEGGAARTACCGFPRRAGWGRWWPSISLIRKAAGARKPAGPGRSARALDAGLIVLGCGPQGETVRLLTPLTASDAILEEGLDHLETALSVIA
jgi:4-aminobutyrate aminotransferase/(S)-3-amino-2-methylpropionate transaminase